jgi:hypothetical protein
MIPSWVTGPYLLSWSLALLSNLISITLYLHQRKSKLLMYGVYPTSSRESVKGSIKVMYDDQPIEGLEGVTIKVKNTGTEEVKRTDYDRPVTIDFGEHAQILSAEIAETWPKAIGATVSVKEGSSQLAPILLNPGDSVTISVLLTQFEKDKLEVNGHIVGGKLIDRRIAEAAAKRLWRFVTIPVVIAVWFLIFINVIASKR